MLPELNLHINYDCPLNCRYCVQRADESLKGQYLTAEEMIEKVQSFLDYIDKPICKVNISGGEPLLKFEDIKILMEHFPNNVYEISTSGYLLTEDKAKYFSYFGVNYILSVDGPEKVTNYFRPLANGRMGYFKQLKKNIPHILYYAPKTRAKLIVSKNLIEEIYPTYLELERLGFNNIFITPNVYENGVDNYNPELQTGIWNEEDWIKFDQQIEKIHNEIAISLTLNKKRCLITNVITPATKALTNIKNKQFNPEEVICSVLDFKSGTGPEFGQYQGGFGKISSCIEKIKIPNLATQEDLVKRAHADFDKLNGVCLKDKDCPYQSTCVYSICLAENLKEDANRNIWIASDFQCKTQKIYHKYAYEFLDLLNQQLETDIANYYLSIIKEGRDYFNGTK